MAGIDPTDLSRWFDRHSPSLVMYARQWLTGGLAEDVVQDAFVRLMAQRTPPKNVKAWLFRVVRNAAISGYRSQRRRQMREQHAGSRRVTWFEDRPDDLIDAATAQEALAALSDEQREPIVLRTWCEMGFQEIADLVGAPVSTVFSRYEAGLAAMRRRLELSCKTRIP